MILWSQEYETGVATVDDDHRRLAASLNELEAALRDGAGSQKIAALLDFLEQYAKAHFAREEGCMAQYRCPTAIANQAAHREFILKFTAARERLRKSSGAAALVAIQVHRELSDWIVNHILRIDTALRTCRPATRVP